MAEAQSNSAPAGNDRKSQGQFEGMVESDLKWIKGAVSNIQKLCSERGERIQRCEIGLCQFDDADKRLTEQATQYEKRLRDCETGLTQTKAVGGLLGLVAGFVAAIFGNWWKAS